MYIYKICIVYLKESSHIEKSTASCIYSSNLKYVLFLWPDVWLHILFFTNTFLRVWPLVKFILWFVYFQTLHYFLGITLYWINRNLSTFTNFANARYLHKPYHWGMHNVFKICLCLVLIMKAIYLLMDPKSCWGLLCHLFFVKKWWLKSPLVISVSLI